MQKSEAALRASGKIARWGCEARICRADTNGSGTVDVDDLIAIILTVGRMSRAAEPVPRRCQPQWRGRCRRSHLSHPGLGPLLVAKEHRNDMQADHLDRHHRHEFDGTQDIRRV